MWIDIKETPLPDEENRFLISSGNDVELIQRYLVSSKWTEPHYTNTYVCGCHEGSSPYDCYIKYWQYAPKPPNQQKQAFDSLTTEA